MAGTLGAVEYLAGFDEGGDAHADMRPSAAAIHRAFDRLVAWEHMLTRRLINGFSSFRGLTIRGVTSDNAMHRRVPTVSFTLDGHHPAGHRQGTGGRQYLRLVRA